MTRATTLTDYTRGPESIREITQHTACPFCGIPTDEHHTGLIGLNCRVCTACHENLHMYTPRVIVAYDDACNVQITSYQSPIDDWGDEVAAVFLTAYPRDSPVGTHPQSIPAPDATEFSSVVQEVILAAVTDDPLPDDQLSIDHTAEFIWNDTLAAITPFKTPDEAVTESRVKHMLQTMPRPTIITPATLYSPDTDQLTETLYRGAEQTAQVTLGDI